MTSQDCQIFDLNVEAIECSPNGVFWAILNFESMNTGVEGFTVLGNGNNYGDFSYDDLPIELGPLDVNCDLIHEFAVIDNQLDSCGTFVVLEVPACCEMECNIEITNIDEGECDSLGFRQIAFVVQNDNPGESFSTTN